MNFWTKFFLGKSTLAISLASHFSSDKAVLAYVGVINCGKFASVQRMSEVKNSIAEEFEIARQKQVLASLALILTSLFVFFLSSSYSPSPSPLTQKALYISVG